jgi:transcriptional regulator with XRE-family HTH domain
MVKQLLVSQIEDYIMRQVNAQLRESIISRQGRDRQIGQIIKLACEAKHCSIRQCAKLLNTSWRRYSALEKGETPIYASELEVLVSFLDIPPQLIYPQNTSHSTLQEDVEVKHQMGGSSSLLQVINAVPGQMVYVVIRVAKAPDLDDIVATLRARRARGHQGK